MEVKNYLSTQQAEQWAQMVGEARNIVVLGHAGPDGDAMGAILALTHHLHAAGKEVVPITPNACPDGCQAWSKLCSSETIRARHKRPSRSVTSYSASISILSRDWRTCVHWWRTAAHRV